MPNRIIKESIHTSEDVNRMTDFQFRLWVSLITYVDDYGRGDARPAVIKGSCFPLRDRITIKDIDTALKALADIGCVSLYEVDGKPYLYFPTWESHQNIRNQKSKYPAPPQNQELKSIARNCNQLNSIEINCNQLHADVPVIQSNPNPNTNPNTNPNPKESEREKSATSRFVPPTVEEVEAYCRERGNNIDAGMFVDFYTSKGWKVGKETMRDWKASVRTWERGRDDGNRGNQSRSVDRTETQTSDEKWGITYSA